MRTAPFQSTVLQIADALDLDADEREQLERAAARRPRDGSAPQGVDRTLLVTKLTAPAPRPSLVDRHRLLDRLSTGVAGPLTLLSAPAGSGKTTLLSAWHTAHQGNASTAWVSLDAGDNDASRFWSYLIGAIDRATGAIDTPLKEMLRLPRPATWESVVTLLVNDLAALDDDLLLVLDDYHVIENEDIHRALNFLVEHMPPHLHLLISSRSDPPLPLPRLRVREAVTEIRLADLRFTQDEAAAFLNEVMRLTLPPDAVASLAERTEGWIAGLQLAALSLQGLPRESAAAFIAAFAGSHRYIVDYLMDEVLLRQPAPVQEFLLSTSILDRLSPSLCATVLHGVARSHPQVVAVQDMLEKLDRQNLFLVALDSEGRCYRYHHLFAEALRRRLKVQLSDVAPLHRRAAEWYEGHNLLLPAINHRLEAGDADRAGDILLRAAPVLFERGELDTLLSLLQRLPERVVRARPRLCVICALARIDARDPDGAEGYLQAAEAGLDSVPDEERRSLRADIAVTRSNVHAMRGDATAVIPQIDAVRADLDPDRPVMQSLAAMSTGFALLYRGEAMRAAEAFHDAWEISRDESNGYAMLLAAMGESYACRAAGAVQRAEATCRSAIRWSEERSHPSPIVATLYANLADLLLERNDLDAALREAEGAVSIAATPAGREGRWLEWRLFSDLVLARVQHARGDTAGARAVLREARSRLEGVYVTPLTMLFDAVETQMDLAEGKVATAQERLTAGNQHRMLHLGLSPQYYVYAYEHLAVAPIQIGIARARERGAKTGLRAVATALADTEMRAERDRIPWLQAKTGALSALLTTQRGDEEAALGPLSRAVDDAAGRYVRLFLDEGTPMVSLLRVLHERDAGRGGVAGLLEAWQTAAR